MLEKAVVIIGEGNVTPNNIHALLDDNLPEQSLVFIPNYIGTGNEGLRDVWQWLDKYGVTYERIKTDELFTRLTTSGAAVKELIILGEGGCENQVEAAWKIGYPVKDLTRGLFEVAKGSAKTQMPPGGPESHATQPSDLPASDPMPGLVNALDSLSALQRKEVEEIVTATIRAHEEGFHPTDVPVISEPETAPEGTVTYYRSKTGKLRKAGNSKPRPGEEVVHLSQEEIDAL